MFSIMIHPPKIKQVHSIKYKFRELYIIYHTPKTLNNTAFALFFLNSIR